MTLQVAFWLSVGLICYVYLGYPILLLLMGMFKRYHPYGPLNELPVVSLVIVAHNEEKVIRDKLENSLRLDYPKDKLEIIVASDASTDATDGIALEYGDKGVRLLRRPTRGSQTGAQNYAAPQAVGEIIVFSDANSMYAPEAIRELIKPFGHTDVGCVVGRLSHSNPNSSLVSYGETLYWRYESMLKTAQSRAGALMFAPGAIHAVRRNLYSPVDSRFDHDTIVPLRCLIAGYRVVYQPSAIAHEEAAADTSREFRRRVRTTVRDALTFLHLRLLLPNLWLTFHLLSHKILRWSMGIPLALVLLLNLFLLSDVLFRVTLAVQLTFYSMAALAPLFQSRGAVPRIMSIPFFFCMSNVAFLVGLAKMGFGQRNFSWRPRDW